MAGFRLFGSLRNRPPDETVSTINEENTSIPAPEEDPPQDPCCDCDSLASPPSTEPESTNPEIVTEHKQPEENQVPTSAESSQPLDTLPKDEPTARISSGIDADQVSIPLATPTDFSLPNGKDGESYRVEHLKEKLFGKASSDITHYYVQGLEESGISLLEDEDTLAGIPSLTDNEPKSIQVELYYHLRTQPRARPFQHNLRFAINPDPRKLWKHIPSNGEVPYWKADEDSECLEEPGSGKLIAASKRGRSHAHEGTCRDDHYAIKYFHQSGWWLSIVADGAGSAIYSRKGAEIACTSGTKFFEDSIPLLDSAAMTNAVGEYAAGSETARKEVSRQLQELFLRQVGYPVFRKIFDHAKLNSHKAKDYNTTFLISAWKRTSEGWFVCAFAIGDGGVAVLHGTEVTPLSKGDEGEFSGETVFLTSTGVWQDSAALGDRVKFGLFNDVRGIYGMSDGITDPKFETDHNFSQPEKWREFTDEITNHLDESGTPEKRLLDWMDFWSPGNHDDRTLTVFFPVPHIGQCNDDAKDNQTERN